MSERLFTEVSNFEDPSEGYIVIAPVSEPTRQKIADIQARFVERFGQDNLWIPTDEQLHVTYAHIITPNIDYGEDRAELFLRLKPLAVAALDKTVAFPLSIPIEFDTVEAHPSAVIMKATDDGSFQRMRRGFVDNFALPEQTRMPPEIIHTTIIRFKSQLDFADVQDLTGKIMQNLEPIEEHVTKLQLIREKKIFVQEHDVLEEFPRAQ